MQPEDTVSELCPLPSICKQSKKNCSPPPPPPQKKKKTNKNRPGYLSTENIISDVLVLK